MATIAPPRMKDRLLTPSALQLIADLDEHFGKRRLELLEAARVRREQFRSGDISPLAGTARVRA